MAKTQILMSLKIWKGHKIGIQAAKTSHFSVFDGFDYIKFIDVCRVTPPADVEVVNGQLNCNLAAL